MSGKHRQGIATLMAILILAFAAVALAAIASWVAYDARRTREGRQDAQLRQLLHAVAAAAIDRAGNAKDGDEEIRVPAGIQSSLTLRFTEHSDQACVAHLTAVVEGRRQTQTLRLKKSDKAWVIFEARLGD
jgi:hypothetical protein